MNAHFFAKYIAPSLTEAFGLPLCSILHRISLNLITSISMTNNTMGK
jgi:hypothetical protein